MGSTVLPKVALFPSSLNPSHSFHYKPYSSPFQALISMPHAIQTPSKLGFPGLSFLPSPLTWRRTAISMPPCSRFCDAITLPTTRRSFIVHAESNPEEGAAEATEESAGEEDAEETASESEAPEVEVEERPPRKPRIKLGEIMGILNKRAIEASQQERPIPDLRTGDIVEIKMVVPDNKRRAAIFKGIVMCKQNAGIHTTVRIRRIIAGIGVEIVFPVLELEGRDFGVQNELLKGFLETRR